VTPEHAEACLTEGEEKRKAYESEEITTKAAI
jgi:hypothetical protein